jgi:catechol 2,3-dioxygenase-like lactoylglutathione lyase family enzyme
MIKFSGVNHIAIATGDMDRTVRFWRDLIGMKLLAAMGQPGFRQYMFEMSACSCDLLVFFEWPEVEPVEEKGHGSPVKGPFGFDHIAIGVEDQDGLFELKDKLNAADIWVSEVIDHEFIRSIYTYDPNGIAVEFSCKAVDVDIREKPVFTDKAPSVITKEGSEPNPAAWPEVKDPTKEEEKKIYKGDFFFTD